MRRSGTHHARGFVLYVVLIVVTIGALMAASVVYAAHAQRASADAASRRVQSRAIAWSGVQAVMESLRSRRDDLIRGGVPDVQDEWTLFTDADGRMAVARLVAMPDGARIVSEAGKLDINTATEAMLATVPGLDEEIARRIISARAGRKFLSVHELEGIEGLRGAVSGMNSGEQGEGVVEDAFVPPGDATASRPLSDLLTVFSFDPNVQAGMGNNAESHTGVRRIGLAVAWSERLGNAITERFDEGAANVVKSLMEQGTKFEKESSIVKVLRRFNVQAHDWAEVLDAFCGDAGPYRLGRIDVLTAPQEVLACVPGIDAAAAEQIVLRRGKLAAEQRLSLVWLVQENVLTPEQFELAVDVLACRSMQWRVVIEAGFVDAGSDRGGESEPALMDRVVVEAVIDVASERPRVAYLREVTMADAARALGPLRPPPVKKKEEPEAVVAAAPPGPAVSSSSGRAGRGVRAGDRDAAPATATPRGGGSDAPAEGPAAAQDESDPRLGRWTPGKS